MRGATAGAFAFGGTADAGDAALRVREFRPDVTVIFDPLSWPWGVAEAGPAGATLGVLVEGPSSGADPPALSGIDRLVSFDPALTGTPLAGQILWRAIPPPVSDVFFAEVRPLRGAPRAMAIGASSEHRESMLLPAKHHHDLLQVIHGVSGELLGELLAEYDVGVAVPHEAGGTVGQQAALHLAAGHLLLSDGISPALGLERNIDYLHVDSADALVWTLDRLARFPEMHQRIRVRGRLKSEQYRASRLFSRLVHDLLADVRAFGASGGSASA